MENLEKFMMCVKNIKPLRDKFISCKDLKESYEIFKIMLNGCGYEEYEKFFKDLIVNSNEISDDDLETVAGGAFSFKNIFTPLAALTVFAGAAAGISYAADVNNTTNENSSSTAQSVVTSVGKEDSDTDKDEKVEDQKVEAKSDAENKSESKTEKVETQKQMKTDEVEEKKSESKTDKQEIQEKSVEEKTEVKDAEENKVEAKTDIGNKNEKTSDTTDAEIEYSLKFLGKLPKKEDQDFDKFLELPNKDELNENRTETIKEKGSDNKEITLNEKEVYDQIQKTVDGIIAKVKSRTPSQEMTEDQIITEINNRKISKHYKLPEELRVAKGIYRWVAKNITYDFDSYDAIKEENGNWKPQDAIFVYNLKSGVCDGYARLTNLMMRMAGVPSSYIRAIDGKDVDYGHAFNAIYVEKSTDKNVGEKGWTLIDSTWGSPNSHKIEDNVNKFMAGNFTFWNDITQFKECLIGDDNYTNELFDTFKDLDDDKVQSLTENDIKDLNIKAAEKLNELNKKYENGAKFEKLEFSYVKDGGYLKVDYKTNVKKEDAVKYQMQQEEQEKIASINEYIKTCFDNYDFGNLEDIFESVSGDIINFNEKKNADFKEKSANYADEVKAKLNEINSNHDKKDFEERLNDINKELKVAIDEINKNPEYKEIVKIDNVYLKVNERRDSADYDIFEKLQVFRETNLTFDEAKAMYEKDHPVFAQEHDVGIKIFFPGFYKEGTLEEANRAILEKSFHKIEDIETNNPLSKDYWSREYYDFEIKLSENERIKCKLFGHETKAHIEISNASDEAITDFRIPKDLRNLNIPFKIGDRIQSLILEGDEEVDLDGASDLKSIDVSESNKYTADDNDYFITVYEKSTDGTKGEPVNFIKKTDKIGENKDVHFGISSDDEIYFVGTENEPAENLVIPQGLQEFSKKYKGEIRIYSGIKSIILQGDEEIDLSYSKDLESIDATKSTRYMVDDGDLYEKNEDGSKGELVWLKKGNKIGTNKDVTVDVSDYIIFLKGESEKPAENLEIPKVLRKLNRKIYIFSGIKSIILQGDEKIDLDNAIDLESIDATKSTRYMVDDGDLYEKNEDGSKGELVWSKK